MPTSVQPTKGKKIRLTELKMISICKCNLIIIKLIKHMVSRLKNQYVGGFKNQ